MSTVAKQFNIDFPGNCISYIQWKLFNKNKITLTFFHKRKKNHALFQIPKG